MIESAKTPNAELHGRSGAADFPMKTYLYLSLFSPTAQTWYLGVPSTSPTTSLPFSSVGSSLISTGDVGDHNSTGDTGDPISLRYSIPVISARVKLDASATSESESSFAGMGLAGRSLALLFLLRQIKNDSMPSAMAAKEPRPAPRPIAIVDVPTEAAPVEEGLAEESKTPAAAALVVGVDWAVAFLKRVDDSSVGTGYMDPYIDAVAKTVGFAALKNKSEIVQHVWFVRFARNS
jgi:hypothetical protein